MYCKDYVAIRADYKPYYRSTCSDSEVSHFQNNFFLRCCRGSVPSGINPFDLSKNPSN
jgi:hypothetical protein